MLALLGQKFLEDIVLQLGTPFALWVLNLNICNKKWLYWIKEDTLYCFEDHCVSVWHNRLSFYFHLGSTQTGETRFGSFFVCICLFVISLTTFIGMDIFWWDIVKKRSNTVTLCVISQWRKLGLYDSMLHKLWVVCVLCLRVSVLHLADPHPFDLWIIPLLL